MAEIHGNSRGPTELSERNAALIDSLLGQGASANFGEHTTLIEVLMSAARKEAEQRLLEAEGGRERVAALIDGLDFHDSDCATHNGPAEPIGPCNCWVESARNLLARQWPDTEDHERFFSRYGGNFLDAVDRADQARAALSNGSDHDV